MDSKPVLALQAVKADLEQAIEHYASWRSDARNHVLDLYDQIVHRIAANPNQFPTKYGVVQRAILKRSYYVVYFLKDDDRSTVLAVLDGRDNPRKIRSVVRVRRTRGI